jgi:hypothetical protein
MRSSTGCTRKERRMTFKRNGWWYGDVYYEVPGGKKQRRRWRISEKKWEADEIEHAFAMLMSG